MSNHPDHHFEKIAAQYAQLVDTKPIHIYYERPNLLSLLPKDISGLEILDIGCGSGWYAEYLTNQGALVTALDVSPTMVALTQKRVPQCQVFQADLQQPLTVLNGKLFDIILAPLVIHYVKDWHVLFKNLTEHLKAEGFFILSTHSPYTEYTAFNLENYFQKVLITDDWKNIGKVQFYHHTLHELTESLFQAGFIIERMLEPMPLPEMKEHDGEMYENVTTRPWFLFVKAIKR